MTLKQALTIENCTEHLQGEYFTEVKFEKEENGCLYFYATDEEGYRKHLQFDPNFETGRIIVAVYDEVSRSWHIYDILQD